MKIILLILALFLGSIIFINPIRETPIDDDWAYAQMVTHFIQTGEYQLHPWAAANHPFQTVWGSLFTLALGDSFSSLRLSTLVLVFLGLIAFYKLARELEISRNVSGLLTVCLLACPLFLKFSFSFMTDIPFLMMLIIATLFYYLAFSKKSIPLALIASVFASFTILTRQVGVALLVAVGLFSLFQFSWKKNLALMLLPTLAILWQAYGVFFNPNWGMVLNKARWLVYVSDPANLFATWLIRPAYILIYLTVFCLPLLPAALIYLRKKTPLINISLSSNYILLSLIVGHLSRWKYVFTFPYLPWAFGDLFPQGSLIRPAVTVLILSGSAVLGGLFVSLRSQLGKLGLISLIILCLLFYTLIYNGFGDEYLLVFVPFVLLYLGFFLQKVLATKLLFSLTLFIAIVYFGGSAILVRNNLAREEAVWQGCEQLRLSGIPVMDIYCGFTWTSYYSFNDYLEDTRGKKLTDFTDFFSRYMPNRFKAAKYTVVVSPNELDKNWFLSGRSGPVYIMKKNDQAL